MSESVAGDGAPWRQRLRHFLEAPLFERFIITVIVINGIVLGLETVPVAMRNFGETLVLIDRIALVIFVVELTLKLVAQGLAFFRRGWNWFDFIIVGVSLMPASGPASVLRALRILRTLRLISMWPKMRIVVQALVQAIPGMGSVVALLMVVFYVSAVLATKLFGEAFPDWFGNIAASFYTLFQIMTLESWSMGIVRPVMEVYPFAWLYFVPFILVTTFAVLNLFIAIVVNAMQEVHEPDTAQMELDHREVMRELAALREEMQTMRADLAVQKGADGDG